VVGKIGIGSEMEKKEKKTPINQQVLLIMGEKMHAGKGEKKIFFI
jgi:hypothetical protein